MNNEGDLKIWHIPQIPGKTFEVPVKTVEEAAKLLIVLAKYDMFQLLENVKPDYSNVQGLLVLEDGEWVEWYDENDDDIDAWIDEHNYWSLLDSEEYWMDAEVVKKIKGLA